jgi:hypothetical protein
MAYVNQDNTSNLSKNPSTGENHEKCVVMANDMAGVSLEKQSETHQITMACKPFILDEWLRKMR